MEPRDEQRGMERDMQQDRQQDMQRNMQQGMQQDRQQDIQRDMQQGMQRNMQQGMQQGMQRNMQQDEFMDMERDYEYFKSMYPQTVKRIQALIDDHCDQLEYNGSSMFDEHPDKVHLGTMVDTIYNQAQSMDTDNPELQTEEIPGNPLYGPPYHYGGFEYPPPPPRADYGPYGRPNWLRHLIENMLYNEMLYRRMRYRRRRRRF